MAVSSSWFQNWNPPSNLFPDDHTLHAPIHMKNFSNRFKQKDVSQNINHVSNLLPFFLQLGLMEPPHPKSRTEEEEPPNHITGESTGPFKTVYQWKMLDFAYPTERDRLHAIRTRSFIPENNLPLGVEVYKDRMFVTMPKWKPGVPATLAVVPKHPKARAPKLAPYPSWDYHTTGTCSGLTSVFRVSADTCGRLWVLDSGQIHVTIKPKQICHPQLFVFDLATDQLVVHYEMPAAFIKQDSLYSNIAIDIRDNDCHDVHAYLTDVWRFGLVVFSLKSMRSWRITDHLFYPEPLAAAYNVHGLEFQWTDGLFGMALSPFFSEKQERLLYFHPMSSFREFYVKTSVICNETGWSDVKDAFKVMGQSRGKAGHVSASGIDRNGVMFFNLVTRDSVGCWDSRKPYKRDNLGVVAKSGETLVFPNDLKVDNEKRQSVWVLSNRLPFYLYKGLKRDEVNFRIMTAFVDEAIEGTICDPRIERYDSFVGFDGEEDCY